MSNEQKEGYILDKIEENRVEADREFEEITQVIENFAEKMERIKGDNQRNGIRLRELLARILRLENDRGKGFEKTDRTMCANCVFFGGVRNSAGTGLCQVEPALIERHHEDFCRNFQDCKPEGK